MNAAVLEHRWTVLGSLVVAAGSTLAGLASFDGDVPRVMLGFLLFIVGYAVTQSGVSPGPVVSGDGVGVARALRRGARRPSLVDGGVGWTELSRAGLLVAGWAGIALGVTLFSRTILDPSVSNAVLSGVSSITGYMAAHVGINGVGVGDSVFGPLLERFERVDGRGSAGDD